MDMYIYIYMYYYIYVYGLIYVIIISGSELLDCQFLDCKKMQATQKDQKSRNHSKTVYTTHYTLIIVDLMKEKPVRWIIISGL